MSGTFGTVLLVDDERSILDVLSLGFKRAGVAVKTATSAEDAVELLKGEPFGALVTDKNLPGMSGLQLLAVMKEHQPDCARVLITGYVSTDSVLEALRLGADDYLLKPFESIMLVVERVKQAMNHRQVHRERAQLALTLRELERSLRKSESLAFQKGTELELFQNVLELRVEDATRELTEKVAGLQAQLEGEQERRAVLKQVLGELAAQAGGELARRLQAEAELMG